MVRIELSPAPENFFTVPHFFEESETLGFQIAHQIQCSSVVRHENPKLTPARIESMAHAYVDWTIAFRLGGATRG